MMLGNRLERYQWLLSNTIEEEAGLQARAIQFWTPGMPMVYYNGLLAQLNDFQVAIPELHQT